MANDIDGVWRTVGGRRIFIRNGQNLATAMKESGKFKLVKNKQNDKKKLSSQELRKRKDDLEIKLQETESIQEKKKLKKQLSELDDLIYEKEMLEWDKDLANKSKDIKTKVEDLFTKKKELERKKAELEIKEDLAKPIEKSASQETNELFDKNKFLQIDDNEFTELGVKQNITTEEETILYDANQGFIGTNFAMKINNCLRDETLEMNFQQRKVKDTLNNVIQKTKQIMI